MRRCGSIVEERAVADEFSVEAAIVSVVDLLGHQPVEERADLARRRCCVDRYGGPRRGLRSHRARARTVTAIWRSWATPLRRSAPLFRRLIQRLQVLYSRGTSYKQAVSTYRVNAATSVGESMTAQRVTAIAYIVVLASTVGFSQVKTTVPDVVRGARSSRRRAHRDSRRGARRQPGRGRRRPRRSRVSAARRRRRTEPSLSGRVRASRLLNRCTSMSPCSLSAR